MDWKFADNLRYLRVKNGLEQSQIATLLDKKSTSAVSEWEKGIRLPSVGELDTLANYFNLTIDDLVKVDIQEREVMEIVRTTIDKNDPFSELRFALDNMLKRKINNINQLSKVEYDLLKAQADYCMNAYLDQGKALEQNPSD